MNDPTRESQASPWAVALFVFSCAFAVVTAGLVTLPLFPV